MEKVIEVFVRRYSGIGTITFFYESAVKMFIVMNSDLKALIPDLPQMQKLLLKTIRNFFHK